MKPILDIKKVEDCNEFLERISMDYTTNQNLGWYIDHMGVILNYFAFVNGQIAVAEELLNEAKKRAYDQFLVTHNAETMKYNATLIKDYISTSVSKEQYIVKTCDRARSTCERTLDALRTMVSALKAELNAFK